MESQNSPIRNRAPLSQTRLPFFGLGFDLSLVRAQAAACVLLPLNAVDIEPMLSADSEAPCMAGYALQLRLNRETRAG